MNQEKLPIIGITIGDINGIGPEVVLKALDNASINRTCIPVIYGSGKHLSKYKYLVDMPKWQYVVISDPKQANQRNVNLINCTNQEYFELEIGKSSKLAGKLAFDCLERATNDLKEGKIDALVTAPISKENIQNENFKFPGHTEYLAKQFDKEEDVLMFMVSDDLKVAVVTGHVPVTEVRLNKKLIASKLNIMLQSLKIDFGLNKPKIAVLGLNPHAGENGLLGKEEKEIIGPCIEDFKKNGHLIYGPFAADGFFGANQYAQYDAVLAMYHDQGLMPFKMLAFEKGVNFTAGLLGIRTSPDHGTAYDIAGKNEADPSSMTHAIYQAIDIAKKRNEFIEIEKGALKHQKIDLDNLKKEKY